MTNKDGIDPRKSALSASSVFHQTGTRIERIKRVYADFFLPGINPRKSALSASSVFLTDEHTD